MYYRGLVQLLFVERNKKTHVVAWLSDIYFLMLPLEVTKRKGKCITYNKNFHYIVMESQPFSHCLNQLFFMVIFRNSLFIIVIMLLDIMIY